MRVMVGRRNARAACYRVVSAVAANRNGETASEILRPPFLFATRKPSRLIAIEGHVITEIFRIFTVSVKMRENYNIVRLDT